MEIKLQTGSDDAILYFYGNCCQMIANAWARHAQTGADLEQCIVSSALNKSVFHIKELVFKPLEAGTSMRAAINESMKLIIFMYHEEVERMRRQLNTKGLTARVTYIRGFTEVE